MSPCTKINLKWTKDLNKNNGIGRTNLGGEALGRVEDGMSGGITLKTFQKR